MPTTNTTPTTYELLTIRQDKAGQAGHWQTTPQSPYDNSNIAESNSSSTTEPTSIPSPFARMELARTAFAIAASYSTWDEVPNRYKKIVSDCLDVAEIFFNYPMYSNVVEIIKWDKKSNLGNTPFATTEIGKAMNKFIQSDNGSYHFERMSAIYFLNYTGDNRPNKNGLNIIGATSPITMFFSVNNDLSYVGETIHFTNQDLPFDSEHTPLENRDINFIQYLVDLIDECGEENFAKDFEAFYKYVITSINRLPNTVQITHGQNSYDKIDLTKGSGDFVKILDYFIGCEKEKQPVLSDFEIDSKLVTEGTLPLVLPVTVGNAYSKCAYINVNDVWGSLCAPQKDDNPLNERIVPGRNVQYPYLTLSDFFEDTIIKMPYKLNSATYFNGNQESTEEESYLLPFKPILFDYFTTDEVRSMVKMQVSDTVVKITLKIPIKNYTHKAGLPYISYTKTYQTNKNEVYNIGDTITVKLGLGIFPLVRTNDERVADYRVALLDKAGVDHVRFYYQTQEITNVTSKVRREYNVVCGIKTYVISKQHFDRIDISIGHNHGYIIPIFDQNEGTKRYHFAVDFGTTNTHIAYSIDNERDSSALESSPQMSCLHESYKSDRDIVAAFEDNYLPTGLSSTQIKFPLRSAFAEARPIDYGLATNTLSDGNIPFRYEKEGPVDYLDIHTEDNLKWSANSGRIELYIRNIAFILHNKVLMEKGSLKNVQIRWFYPTSMSRFVRDMMERAWNKAYKDYFDADFTTGAEKITCMSESIAPYCHYFNNDGAVGVVTTIDIGGGTTDVYISDNQHGANQDGYLMSFRCASNAIFGDGYNNNIKNNGFIRKYRPIFEAALQGQDSLLNAMQNIALKGNSSELVSFFFSLATQEQPGLNFMDKLVEDQKLKYVFLVFYSAIIYHVAHTMKAKGIDMPQTVAFSGNGSKTLQVISQNHTVLEMFVKNIFEKVYGKTYSNRHNFYLKYDNERPKEATANGGLEATNEQATATPKSVVLLGTDNKTFVQQETYTSITPEQKNEIISNVLEFIDFIPSLNDDNTFGNAYNLDVSILEDVLETCKENLDNYLDLGIDKVNKLLSSDRTQTNSITESLFFFPIVGMLNNLATKL